MIFFKIRPNFESSKQVNFPIYAYDEIGLLANSFNEMSRKMSADIAELQRLNEQLVRTEKLAAMGTLAAGVALEVNNPLASISSLVQIMRAADGHSDETRERLSLISTQIERIGQVTRDMTNFARSRPAARGEIDWRFNAASDGIDRKGKWRNTNAGAPSGR